MPSSCPGIFRCVKPLFLYGNKRSSMTIEVLTQYLDSWHQPMIYLSKHLDSVAKGWPPCLWALAATALLVSETEKKKLTLGGEITVWVPHSDVTLTECKRQYWLTNARMVRYKSMLCKNPQVQLKAVWTLNPVILFLLGAGLPKHNCIEVINEVFFLKLS
jgi:hypothetical protein